MRKRLRHSNCVKIFFPSHATQAGTDKIGSRQPLFLACLLPLARLAWLGVNDRLGANPIEFITHSTGWWTLAFVLITLGVTPLRKLTGLNWLLRLRRMPGLFAFFYASLHFIT